MYQKKNMKISQKKGNQVKRKLCAKSFINSKKDDSLLNTSNKKAKGKYILKKFIIIYIKKYKI